MNQPILTTKGTNKAYLITNLLPNFFIIALGFFLIDKGEEMWWKAADYNYAALIAFAIALISTFIDVYHSTCFAEVYSDKIVGKGIQNFQVVDFNFTYEQITNITYTGPKLYIEIVGSKYKIITNEKTSKEIFDYYTQNIRK